MATSPARAQPSADAVVDVRPPQAPKAAIQLPSERFGLGRADPIPLIAARALDLDPVHAEDEQQRRAGDRRLRIGVKRDLWLSPDMGRWDVLPDDAGRIWRADIASPGARGLRIHFMKLRLAAGGGLFVYSLDNPSIFFGPFDSASASPLGDGQFWAPTCFGGESVRIEYFEPPSKPGVQPAAPFIIDAVQHIYQDPAQALESRGLGDRLGNCHNDVTCQSVWSTTALAVGGIGSVDISGQILCTGQLLATTTNDLTPYFLTANHCVGSAAAAATAEIYWRYQTSSCNGTPPDIAAAPRSWPCTLISTADQFTGTDYALLMIEGTLPSGLAWVGWTTADQPVGTTSACIQHPDGSYKRIAFGNKVAGQACGTPSFTQTHWTSGVTEVGSSGSGLYRVSDRRLYGHLSCGLSACVGASTNGLNDDFGRFDLTYAAIGPATLDAGTDDAFEPNSTCAAARPLPVGVFPNLVVKSTNEDWYSFTLSPGQSITAALSFIHAHGDIDAQLFTTCGGSAVSQSASVTNNETLSWNNSTGAARTVLLRVYLFSDTRNTYSLSLSVSGVTNNSCANAPAIAVNTPVTGTTVGATNDGSAGCGAAPLPNTAPDVWYTFVPPNSEVYRFDTAGSGFDTVLSVHSACPGTAANQLGCNDDVAGGNLSSQLDLNLTAGLTYRVRVAGFNQLTGPFNLVITQRTGLVNDLCSGAIDVTDGFTPFSTVGATTDGPDEPAACNFFGDPAIAADVWFRYTASCAGLVEVHTCAGGSGNFDTELAVYGATCPLATGSVIACNDDNSMVCGSGTFRSAVSFSALPGQRFLIRVGGFGGSTGSAGLNISCSPTGVCCAADGSCTSTTQLICSGMWSLAGACAPNPCAAPAGACCDVSGCCSVTAQSTCTGSWQVATTCEPDPCSPSAGACCAADGACATTSLCLCTGSFMLGSLCQPNPCPRPLGACCDGANCSVWTEDVCIGPNTAFAGPGTACSAAAPCCRGDFNKSGAPPTVQDIFDFLSAYFANDPSADANDSGSNSVQDIFDFLASYFAGC